MPEPTAYQCVKLGANLEFLRGICTVSIMQTSSLAAQPNLLSNLPGQRYIVPRVAEVVRSLLVLLEEMKLEQSLQVADPFRPMLKEMEDYLAGIPKPELTHLTDQFAERLLLLGRQVGLAARSELGLRGLAAASPMENQSAGQPT